MHLITERMLLMDSMQSTICFMKGQIEIIGTLESDVTTKLVILPSSSTDVSNNSSDQYIHILNNKERYNGLKRSTKMKNI